MSLPASIWPKVSALSLVLARHAEPEHVHRRAVVVAHESGFLAHGRMASVAADHQVGADREPAVRRFRTQADDAAGLLDEVCRLGLHAQIERRVAPGLLGQEIEKVPLRHQGDEFAAGRQMAEVRHLDALGADLSRSAFRPSDAALQEVVDQAQFAHQLERRRMNRVAAEIAEEVRMLLQHHDVDAGARQQEAEHHSRGPAAGDAALRGDG